MQASANPGTPGSPELRPDPSAAALDEVVADARIAAAAAAQAVPKPGIASKATFDEALALFRAFGASAHAGVKLAGAEWSLFKLGMQRIVLLLPLFLVLALSLWATLLFGTFHLLETLTGSVLAGYAGVVVLQLLVLGLGAWILVGVVRHAFFPLTRRHLEAGIQHFGRPDRAAAEQPT